MMRSMFSGVSSLRVHQTRMDVIANNIANVNTVGFKSQRATFQDAFYQMIQGASGPDPVMGRAGVNPQQIGLGLNLGSIDNIMTQGASQRTDNPLDLMLTGPGFFIVDTPMGRAFTRAGNVNMDREMNLHINGMRLLGWSAEPDGVGGFRVARGELAPLSLARVQTMDAQSTTHIEFVGNLTREGLYPYDETDLLGPTEHIARTLTIYDSLGTRWTLDVHFRFHPEYSSASQSQHSVWTYEFVNMPDVTLPDGVTQPAGTVMAWRENDREPPAVPAFLEIGADGTGAGAVGTLVFNQRGTFVGAGAATGEGGTISPSAVAAPGGDFTSAPFVLTIGAHEPGGLVNPSAFFGGAPKPDGRLTVNTDNFFQRAEPLTLRTAATNGNRPGRLADISVGGDGTIAGRFTNGLTRIIGQIPIALFDNPAGLERGGSNLWFETVNSGPFDGAGTVGEMQGGALEMSNVDLAAEFTEMITTQRGFQAASRTISVSDEMLQELVNLRR